MIMSVSFVDTDTVNDVDVAAAAVPLTEPDITTFCKALALKYCPTTVTVAPGPAEAGLMTALQAARTPRCGWYSQAQ
jgi:hypothetical protein